MNAVENAKRKLESKAGRRRKAVVTAVFTVDKGVRVKDKKAIKLWSATVRGYFIKK
jgi:hypothetical protein